MKPPEPYRSRIAARNRERIERGELWYQRGVGRLRITLTNTAPIDASRVLEELHFSVEGFAELEARVLEFAGAPGEVVAVTFGRGKA